MATKEGGMLTRTRTRVVCVWPKSPRDALIDCVPSGAGAHLAVVSPSLILVAGGLGVAAIDVSDPLQATKVAVTSSGVATREGGAHLSLYGDRNQHAFVVGGRGLVVLPTNHDEWLPPQGGCCQVM